MKKVIIATVLIIVLIGQPGQALAFNAGTPEIEKETENISPRLTLINSINPSMRVSGTTATYALIVTCATTVNNVKVVLQIQQMKNGSWVDYGKSWDASASTSYLYTNGTKTVASGFSYRLKVTVTATAGTSTGSATTYS